jgi:hypothetical protein
MESGPGCDMTCCVFYTRPGRPYVPKSLLYKGYWDKLPGVNRLGRGIDQAPLLSAEVKNG